MMNKGFMQSQNYTPMQIPPLHPSRASSPVLPISQPDQFNMMRASQFPQRIAQYYPQYGPQTNDVQFDESEFPVLSSTRSPHTEGSQSPYNLGRIQPSGFHIENEDFPALPSRSTAEWKRSEGHSESVTSYSQEAPNQYGIMGILPVIQKTSDDLNTLALGINLTSLGLSLSSTEKLYSTFSSPWNEEPANEPEHFLPPCYSVKTNSAANHLDKFQIKTLIYIFYSMSQDELQLLAAQRLYRMGWRYHKECKLWFMRMVDSQSAPQYAYFDLNSWEQRLYTTPISDSDLLSESELEIYLNA